MKKLASLLASLLLFATISGASSAPTISQVFAFSCNQNFTQCPYGFDPALGPIQLANGVLYGTTWWAGQGTANAGGTVFGLTNAGQIRVLHTFEPGLNGK